MPNENEMIRGVNNLHRTIRRLPPIPPRPQGMAAVTALLGVALSSAEGVTAELEGEESPEHDPATCPRCAAFRETGTFDLGNGVTVERVEDGLVFRVPISTLVPPWAQEGRGMLVEDLLDESTLEFVRKQRERAAAET